MFQTLTPGLPKATEGETGQLRGLRHSPGREAAKPHCSRPVRPALTTVCLRDFSVGCFLTTASSEQSLSQQIPSTGASFPTALASL
jgi:hypothetical protein